MKTYSVRQMIAILQDLQEDGYSTLDEQELLTALGVTKEAKE